MQNSPERLFAPGKRAFERLRGARVFVAGGTGFFGAWLLESLLWANRSLGLGARATLLSRDPAAFARRRPELASDPAVSLQKGDVRSFSFPREHFTHLIHGAFDADRRYMRLGARAIRETIVQGTRRMLECARRTGAESFLYVSSGAVYGPQPSRLARIPETYPGKPAPGDADYAYAQAKRAGEALCAAQVERGLDVKIARCFAFVGPHLPIDAHYAVGNFIAQALRGGPVAVQGDGTPLRSYMYGSDLAVWLWNVLAFGRSGRPYNVGSERSVSVGDLARKIARFSSCEAKILGRPVPGRRTGRYIPSTARARRELGVRETVALDQALRWTLDWHKIKQ